MVIEEVLPMADATLARLLRDPGESGRTLVLDCRPFLAFCQAHLADSRPVHWNGLLRRRSRGRSGVSLDWLLPDRALLARLRRGELAHLVVLDEASGSLAALRPDSLPRLLLNALLQDERAGTSRIYLLEGTHLRRAPSLRGLSAPRTSPGGWSPSSVGRQRAWELSTEDGGAGATAKELSRGSVEAGKLGGGGAWKNKGPQNGLGGGGWRARPLPKHRLGRP